jgi:hypothetical protein
MDLPEISARLEIQDLLARYTYAVDSQDWDVLDRTFTPDAAIDYTATGGISGSYAEAKAWLRATLPGPFASTMHMLGLPVIDLSDPTAGDSTPRAARVRAYLDNPMRMDDGHGGLKIVELGAVYHAELVRTADGWRITTLRQELRWDRGFTA